MYYVLAKYAAYMFLICGVKPKGNNHAKIAIAMITIFRIYGHDID